MQRRTEKECGSDQSLAGNPEKKKKTLIPEYKVNQMSMPSVFCKHEVRIFHIQKAFLLREERKVLKND